MFRFLYRILQGALIGGGAILPGISGGVLAVLFGIYHPIMELLTHPFKTIKTQWKLFLPIGIGAAIGFVLFAKLVDLMFSGTQQYAVCLFVGLILGELPSLFREANSRGKSRGSWGALLIAFAVLLGLLIFLEVGVGLTITPSIWWFLFCGAVWGFSLIVPGMSSSSILIFIGLYQPMSAGISQLDLGVIIPVGVGILATALIFARFVKKLFDRHFTVASYAVIGLVIASTAMIIPLHYSGVVEVLLCLGCAVVGFFIAMAMDLLGKKLEKSEA